MAEGVCMPCEVAKRAGFCVGVRRAVELAQQAAQCAKLRGIPCYSLGDVVHNPSVTQHLRDMGVQVVSRVVMSSSRACFWVSSW